MTRHTQVPPQRDFDALDEANEAAIRTQRSRERAMLGVWVGGTFLALGQYTDRGPTPLNPHVITRKQLRIVGSWGFAEKHYLGHVQALAVMDQTGARHDEPELYRIKGELLLRQAVPDELQAEACFQQALAVARRRQAKSWELRAAISLGRLWQRQGQRVEALELLALIYGWFTEGFDTADLREAKALLEELS